MTDGQLNDTGNKLAIAPAGSSLVGSTREYFRSTRTVEGVHSIPQGLEYYQACLDWYLGVRVAPEEIFDLGVREVARIEANIKKIMAEVGFSGTLKSFFQHVKFIPKFYNHTKEDLLIGYNMLLGETIQPRLSRMFYNFHIPTVTLQSTEDVSVIRSPSPPVPPPPPTRFPSKRRRVSKAMKDAFKAIDSIKGELRKGTRHRHRPPCGDSGQSCAERLPAGACASHQRHPPFSMSKSDMFYSLQTQMADVLGVRVEQIGLYLNDSRLASSDTPLSIRLHLVDIKVCHILVPKQGDSDEEETYSTDNIKVQMQCRNSRQKTSMIVKKFLPLKFMMEKYAQKQGKPLEALQFHFDGELLQPEMMPNDVELDNDDTIDVVEMK